MNYLDKNGLQRLWGKALAKFAKKSKSIEKTLNANEWVDGTYSLSISGVTTTSVQEILPSTSITQEELSALQSANIQDNGQNTNVIVLKAFGDVPTINIPIRIIMRGDM